jgi:protein-tyrosine phosphatase
MVIEGALNFRDASVGPVKPGRLLRSDTLQFLTPRDIDYLVGGIGLRTVIDLRLDYELKIEGRGPLAATEVEHVHLPFTVTGTRVEGTATPILQEHDPIVPHYLGYLESTPESVAGVFRVLARPERVPVVIHCAAGKDRTGVAVAMVLHVAGVSIDEIAVEYAAGSDKVPAVFERLRQMESYGDTVMNLPAEAKLTKQESIPRFFAEVQRIYGGVDEYLISAGVTEAELVQVRTNLTD